MWVLGTHVPCPGEPTGRQPVGATHAASVMKLLGSLMLPGPQMSLAPEEQTTPPKPVLQNANCTLVPSQKQGLC